MALMKGKQIKDATIANVKLVETYINADGTVSMAAALAMGSNKLTGLTDPTASQDGATKAYVDSVAVGLRDFKDSVKAATAAALAANTRAGNVLTADANGAFGTVDGVTITTDGVAGANDGTEAGSDHVLVKDEATGANDGIYFLSDPGSAGFPWKLTRRSDADASDEVTAGMYLYVDQGTDNDDTAWVLSTNDPITLNTTALVFTKFSSLGQITAGAGLTKTAETIDVGDANKGIQVNANDLELDASEVVGDGVEQVDGGASSHKFRVKLDGDSIARGAGGVKAAVPTTADKGRASAVTSGDGQTTGLTITNTPGGDSIVAVLVNGVQYELGQGVKTKDCYFSADGGTTARAIADIVAADTLFWNGVIAGFDLAADDDIDLNYSVA